MHHLAAAVEGHAAITAEIDKHLAEHQARRQALILAARTATQESG